MIRAYIMWNSVVEAFHFVSLGIREKSYPVLRFRTTFPLRVCNNGTPVEQKSWLQKTCANHYQGPIQEVKSNLDQLVYHLPVGSV